MLLTASKNASRPKGGYRYDDEMKSYASYYRLIAGPLAYQTLQKNLPHVLPSLSSVNRYVHKTNCHVTEGVLRCEELCQYLEERGLEKIVALSEDATRITGRIQYDKFTNQIVGFAPPLNKENGLPVPFSFPARNAQEIIQHFNEKNTTSALVNVVMATPISKNPMSSFCLLIYGTDNKYSADDVCNRWKSIIQQLGEVGVKVLSISTDSDPRYNTAMKKLSQLGNPSKIFRELNWFCCGDRDFSRIFPVFFQDATHLALKLRNLLLKTIKWCDKLPCGKYFIRQSHLSELIELFTKDKHNLSPMVLNPIDKQNFDSVLRICDKKVITLLSKHIVGSQATVKFLEIIKNIIDAHLDTTLRPLERVYKIWNSVFFLRLWREFLNKNKKLSLKEHFLTLNSYNCVELNAHSMLLCIVQLKNQNMPHLFLPNLMDSQPCESLFRQVRSFTTTYSTVANCTVKEILQRISKIQLQSDTVSRIGTNFEFPRPSRNKNINKQKMIIYDLPTIGELLNEIEKSKRDAINDARMIGLISQKKINNFDIKCQLRPHINKRITKKRIFSNNTLKNCLQRTIHFDKISLKNYAEKFVGKRIDKDSSFVEVFKGTKTKKRIVVMKTSFVWLLCKDVVRF